MNYIKFQQMLEDAKLINFFFAGELTKHYEIKINNQRFELEEINLALNHLYESSKLRQQWQAKQENDCIVISLLDIAKNLKAKKFK